MAETALPTRDVDLRRIWGQEAIPVIVRPSARGQKLRMRLPYAKTNRDWLRDGRRANPAWLKDKKYWELPKAWFNDLVDRALAKFGRLYVIQPYREQEVCAPACMNALGHECQCSCMGANHGAGNGGGWFEVSDAFAVRWGGEHIACRLMVRK